MRINRFLAAAGLGSRRQCEELVRNALVHINGTPCTALATDVRPDDRVTVRGRAVRPRAPLHVLLHKPRGTVCTRSDERGRATIYTLLPPEFRHLAHVGRLDRDSEGLLLLTNDGSLAQRLSHPRYGCEKEYQVRLDHPFNPQLIPRLVSGMPLPDGWARLTHARRETDPRSLRVVLRQGLNRQIRRMFDHLGWRVVTLRRVRIGPLTLGTLAPGRWRRLTPAETRAVAQQPGEGPGKDAARSGRVG